MKTAVVDLDGVICDERPTFERSLALPLPGAKAGMKALRDLGYLVIIHSARGWPELAQTMAWLSLHEIPYDQLVLGKPNADILIDDRAVTFTSWDTIGT